MQPITDLSGNSFVCVWDHAPCTPGHMLVIPKRHIQYMAEFNDQERLEIIDAVNRAKNYIKHVNLQHEYNQLLNTEEDVKFRQFITRAIAKIHESNLGAPDAFNDGINDGVAAGQTVPHFHWHIMPRWTGDVDDAVGGVRHMFEGMGNYKRGLEFEK